MLDYTDEIPDFILKAIPGTDPLTAAIDDADRASRRADDKVIPLREAARALALRDDTNAGPRPDVKRADFDKAVDAYRNAALTSEQTHAAYRDALIARFEHVQRGMRDPAFIATHEKLYAEAAQTARDALAALREAIETRDMLARDVIGRPIRKPSPWYGLDAALRDVEGYVDAAMEDADAEAWQIVENAFRDTIRVAGHAHHDSALLARLQAIRDDDSIPASDKADQYRIILRRKGFFGEVR
ncbi:hypothetical protein [Microbacterium sp. USTB-Y]|uniref:hypothetical protein n=1 Tax=Microbacterium sp. USTB-Y TaxID=2823692 RepID=UPI002040E9A1|nr:hypothetical protein [Microbacterium sp. USTB-Y]